MMRTPVQLAKQFFQRVSQVPSGFKKVYAETKLVMSLSNKKKSSGQEYLCRREEELIRTNRLALSKLAGFFLAQIPPIIGYIPLFVYFSYPRQLLTHHFWTEEERAVFPVQDYSDRKIHIDVLKAIIKKSNEVNWNLRTELSALSKLHLRSLAGANTICSSQIVLNLAPSFLLRRWLNSRANELVLDDTLLQQEGLDSLDTIELQNACLRRGLNPCTATQSADSLKSHLSRWIASPVAKRCRDEKPVSAVLLLHATAIPDLYMDENVFQHDATDKLKND